MLVKLKRSWFRPLEARPVNDRRSISGGRLRKGTHEIDPELAKYLPPDAIIISGAPPKEAAEGQSLRDYDNERANAEATVKINNETAAELKRQEDIKARRLAGLERARAAKAAKKEAKD